MYGTRGTLSLPYARRGRFAAFTLIELLIVVAIIAILAAIAVPNFLEAQTRSKVSRVRADMRSLAMAFEAYHVDHNAYPSANSEGTMNWASWATTPVAYITKVHINDPFTPEKTVSGRTRNTLRYYGFNEEGFLNAVSGEGAVLLPAGNHGEPKIKYFALFSHGPDGERSKASNGRTFVSKENLHEPDRFVELIYDPTNGTVSNGDILRVGGVPVGLGAASMRLVERAQ